MSLRTLRLRPQTATDIAGIADAQTPEDAHRFIDAVSEACTHLAGDPDLGAQRHRHVVPELPVPLQSVPVPGFERILLFYMALPDAVELIRAVDTTRGMEALAEEACA